MTDSAAEARSRRAASAAILALTLALGGASAASAQGQAPAAQPDPAPVPPGTPMRLVPLGPPGQAVPAPSPGTEPGGPLSGPPQGLVRPDPVSPSAVGRAPSGVQVETLGAFSADSGGVLDAGQGGLGPDIWRGTPRAVVDRLLPSLPTAVPSAAQRALTRRLLLSSTAAPAGEGAARPLTGKRLELLARMGDPAAARFAAAFPAALEDDAAAQAFTAHELLAGDPAAACAQVPKHMARFKGPEWQKWQIACQVQAGQASGITLGIDLLREQGEKDDMFFRLAEGAAAGVKAPIKGLTEVTSPQLALVRASGRGLPPEATTTDPSGLVAIALSAETPAPARVAAAERAAALGVLDAQKLLQVYGAATVSDADMRAAASVAAKREGTAARTLLVRALTAEKSPAAKAELLKLAVEKADVPLLTGGYGAVLAQEIGQLQAGAGYGFMAPHAARVLLLQGRADLARPWLEVARKEPGFARLWPLAALHGAIRANDVDQGAWLDAMKVESDLAARARSGAVLALLVAAGEPVDPIARLRTLGGQTAGAPLNPDVALWYRLEDAGLANRTGETVLTALSTIGAAGPAGAHPLAVAHAAAFLTAAGLREEARMLAAEAVAALLPP